MIRRSWTQRCLCCSAQQKLRAKLTRGTFSSRKVNERTMDLRFTISHSALSLARLVNTGSSKSRDMQLHHIYAIYPGKCNRDKLLGISRLVLRLTLEITGEYDRDNECNDQPKTWPAQQFCHPNTVAPLPRIAYLAVWEFDLCL